METAVFYFDRERALILWLQTHLSPFILTFPDPVSNPGDRMCMILIPGTLYRSIDKKKGRNILFTVFFTITQFGMIKNTVRRSRPYMGHKEIQCLKVPTEGSTDIYNIAVHGYSFPSGHCANIGAMMGSFCHYLKKRWFNIFAAVLSILMALSRCAMGVHYPADVLTGLILGRICAWLIDDLQDRYDAQKVHLILTVISLIGLCFARSEEYFTAVGILVGFRPAIEVDEKYIHFQTSFRCGVSGIGNLSVS